MPYNFFLSFTCFAIDMTTKGSLANFWGGSKKLTIGSASQIISLEWKVQRSVHKIPSLVSFLSHINPFSNLEKYFRKNNFNIILPVTPNVVECNINAHQSLALRMEEICSSEIFVTPHDTWTNNIWFLEIRVVWGRLMAQSHESLHPDSISSAICQFLKEIIIV
jgi:hypothetical protein